MATNNVITRSNADALIPLEIANEIIKEVPSASKLLPLMRRLPNMTAKQRVLPVQSALPNAYFLNGDMDLKQTTKAEWEKLMLTAEELAVIIPIPEAVLDDSSFDIWGEIRPQIVEALGIAIDQAVLFGTNKPASWPTSIYDGAVAKGNTVAIGTGLDVASDIIGKDGLIAKVENDGYVVNGFIADGSFAPELRDLRDKNNRPIYIPALNSEYSDTIVGREIAYDNSGMFDYTKALMVAGDFRKAVYAIRQDVTYKVLDQAVIQDASGNIVFNLAQQDMIALRVVMRLGVQIANPVTRRAGTNGYPFAVLTPASNTPTPEPEPSDSDSDSDTDATP
jgi:HK97 family phage major capsid protein